MITKRVSRRRQESWLIHFSNLFNRSPLLAITHFHDGERYVTSPTLAVALSFP